MQSAGVRFGPRFWALAAALTLVLGVATTYGERPPTSAAEKPAASEPDPREHGCPWLDDIIDDEALPTSAENREEYLAYNYFVLTARKFTPEQMAKVTRKELTWRILFGKERARYRGQIARVEGRLKRLVWIGSNKSLEGDGVKDLYEAWIFRPNEYYDNPTCVVISELPPGLEPSEDYQKLVSVEADGYFFKRYKYRAANDTRLAPLVIARTLTVKPAVQLPPDPGEEAFNHLFLPLFLTMILGMVVVAFLLHRWFRSGDQRSHEQLLRSREPEFIAPTEPAPRDYGEPASWN
jgi:hypothetical protein